MSDETGYGSVGCQKPASRENKGKQLLRKEGNSKKI